MRIGPITSYIYGITICFVIFVALVFTTTLFTGLSLMAFIVSGGVAIGLFLVGLRQVEVVYEAVLTVLGKRQRIIFTEGIVWIFPGIMGLIEVNIQEKSLVIGDDGKLQVIAVDATIPSTQKNPSDNPTSVGKKPDSPKEPTGRVAQLTTKLVVRYQVTDPYKFLQIELETVEKNLVEYSKSALREYFGKYDYMYLITCKDDADSAIETSFLDEVAKVAGTWGIKPLGLSLAKVTPTNPTVLAALEKAAVEEEEGKGEQKEMDNVIKQVKRLADELGISITEARQLYQSERSKAKVVIYEGLTGSGVKPQIPLEQ